MSGPGNQETFLVIGGDSHIGRRLVLELQGQKRRVLQTTRRPQGPGGPALYLDLLAADDFQIPPQVGYAFFLAALTGVGRCEGNSEAELINAQAIPALIGRLMAAGVFVNFISTHTVFNGLRPAPAEDAAPCPENDYARQKIIGEAAALKPGDKQCEGRAAVTRLTRCLGPNTSPVAEWLAAWKAGQVVRPFTDLSLSLISAHYVAQSLSKIGATRRKGIFHLSGQGSLSFAELAERMGAGLGISRRLIQPVKAEEAGVRLGYAPPHPELGLARTTSLAGLRPQPLAEATADLVADCRGALGA